MRRGNYNSMAAINMAALSGLFDSPRESGYYYNPRLWGRNTEREKIDVNGTERSVVPSELKDRYDYYCEMYWNEDYYSDEDFYLARTAMNLDFYIVGKIRAEQRRIESEKREAERIRINGSRETYKEKLARVWRNDAGDFHRNSGPAVIWDSGKTEWWINGEQLEKSEAKKRQRRL